MSPVLDELWTAQRGAWVGRREENDESWMAGSRGPAGNLWEWRRPYIFYYMQSLIVQNAKRTVHLNFRVSVVGTT